MELPFSVDLNNKTVIITGGAGILCSEMAYAVGKCGANTAILDLNLEAAQAVANKIIEDGGKAIAIKVDVLSKESLENAKTIILDKFSSIDILINGAGGNSAKATINDEVFQSNELNNFFNLNLEGFKFVFDINLIGTLLPTQVFAKEMVNREGSTIVNISSMNAYRPLTKIPAYSSAKAAVSNLTMWLATYFAKSKIRVNAIAPGFFVTNQNRNLLYKNNGDLTERSLKIIKATPMERFGNADELIGTLLWLLCYKASSFVNGIIVPIDGGFSAFSGV